MKIFLMQQLRPGDSVTLKRNGFVRHAVFMGLIGQPFRGGRFRVGGREEVIYSTEVFARWVEIERESR